MPAPHPLARRIHDRVLQLLGTAVMKTELCERLADAGRRDEIPANLAELRAALLEAVDELRAVMGELRNFPPPAAPTGDEPLKTHAA